MDASQGILHLVEEDLVEDFVDPLDGGLAEAARAEEGVGGRVVGGLAVGKVKGVTYRHDGADRDDGGRFGRVAFGVLLRPDDHGEMALRGPFGVVRKGLSLMSLCDADRPRRESFSFLCKNDWHSVCLHLLSFCSFHMYSGYEQQATGQQAKADWPSHGPSRWQWCRSHCSLGSNRRH